MIIINIERVDIITYILKKLLIEIERPVLKLAVFSIFFSCDGEVGGGGGLGKSYCVKSKFEYGFVYPGK